MAKARKLKVFRTPIGFHDAYVAAPSRKAALEAWGSSGDLFAQGAAELVTDPALAKEALAQPGTVVRKLRGSAGEQIKALGVARKRKPAPVAPPPGDKMRKPSRAAIDKAEKAVEQAKSRFRDASAKLAAEERRLEAARKRYRAEMDK